MLLLKFFIKSFEKFDGIEHGSLTINPNNPKIKF